jgi:PAS domain S-box-containing protein
MKRIWTEVKLGITFGFLIAILIAVGWLGLSRMGRINANQSDLFNRYWGRVHLARQAQTIVNLNKGTTIEIFLREHKDKAELDQLRSLRKQNGDRVSALLNKLKQGAQPGKETQLLAQISESRAAFYKTYSRALDLLNQNKSEEGRRQIVEAAIPLATKTDESWEAFAQFEEQQMDLARDRSAEIYAASRWIMGLLVSLAVLIAAETAVLVTRRMGREAAQREQAEAAIRSLNEDLERKVTERTKELARAEQHFRSLVENSPYGILRTTLDGTIQQANKALVDMLGYNSENEIINLHMGLHVFPSPAARRKIIDQFGDQAVVKGIEVAWKRKDGAPIMVRYSRHIVTDRDGIPVYKEIVVEDITERRKLEQQLRQAQKMEAVGQLAGGVAHDFNNLLGVIIGYSELLLDQPGVSGVVQGHAEQIKKAGDRASSLTRQLLAFSRQQVLETRVLNLNTVVTELQKMLPRLIGEDVEIRNALDPALGHVKADQSQIEQVIMNLAVNARDAMPGGGVLTLKTSNVELSAAQPGNHPEMAPGSYVMLAVSDTGVGMDPQILTHIFEPFFTTKERGRGTGLGLATVYGVIKQSGGYIWAESKPGEGSTFRIYLPRAEQAIQSERPSDAASGLPRRSETVLLVEDEESLRTLTRSLLEGIGYSVLEASNGAEAVATAARHTGAIDLLLTDVVMPGMNGHAMADQLIALRPQMAVVFMSGYTDFGHGLVSSEVNFLQKPFSRAILLRKLGEALELRTNQGWEPAVSRA